MSIWFFHLFSRLSKTFLFFLLSIICVFILIDFSVHGAKFLSKSYQFLSYINYYLSEISSMWNLLSTFSFLLAALKVLNDLSTHKELIAIQMAGISKKKILLPFFIFASIIASSFIINKEFKINPTQTQLIATKKTRKLKHKNKLKKVSLSDKASLIYQDYNPVTHELFDVFFIQNDSTIYYIKYVCLEGDQTIGKEVEIFKKEKKGPFLLEKKEPTLDISYLNLSEQKILDKQELIETKKLSQLFHLIFTNPLQANSALCHLLYNLSATLLPFLTLIGISPYLMMYSRHKPVFLIGAISLFGFICLKVITDGMLILGENHVVPCWIAIFLPYGILAAFTVPTYVKMK
jgi:lipopolysaccharide export LptBFGC system permease protein LptF